jgi:glycosyltransferase involved in cell wall biosynthesis
MNQEKQIGALVKKADPKISVVIPAYNTFETIAETLDSVLEQTFTDYEIIVVNDNGPDAEKLKTVLAPYKEKIIFIDKRINEGVSTTRNKAVKEEARGELIAFIDADDIWKPTYLQESYDFLTENNYDMVYVCGELFGITNNVGQTFISSNPAQGTITRELLIGGRCLILPSGSLIGKEKFIRVGGFDPKVLRTEDFHLWMRMIFNGIKIGYLKRVLYKFRLRPGSGSGDLLQRLERNIKVWRTLQNELSFTTEETQIIERHIEIEAVALLRAKGKIFIVQKNWREAKSVFGQAKISAKKLGLPVKHQLKMSIILILLSFYPNALSKLFKNFRDDEIEFM